MSATPVTSLATAHLLSFSRNLCRIETLLSRNTGESFNVFRILKIERRETVTHSPMLKALLDPASAHGQGASFLRLFLEQCGVSDFIPEGATIKEEHYLGPKTEQTGGKIDLLLRDRSGRLLGLENKIDAVDQENQVERYTNFLGKGKLLYLTLEGREPGSLRDALPDTVKCISYSHHITRWLEACRREAATAPLVRETITQYLKIVQEMTHQNEDQNMNIELANAALHNQENLEAYFALCNARLEVDVQITHRLNSTLDQIAAELGLERVVQPSSFRERHARFSFTTGLMKANNLQIAFEFEIENGNGFAFGFVYADHLKGGEYAEDLRKLFGDHFGNPDRSERWPAWKFWEDYQSWSDDLLLEIVYGNRFIADLEDRLKNLRDISITLFANQSNKLT